MGVAGKITSVRSDLHHGKTLKHLKQSLSEYSSTDMSTVTSSMSWIGCIPNAQSSKRSCDVLGPNKDNHEKHNVKGQDKSIWWSNNNVKVVSMVPLPSHTCQNANKPILYYSFHIMMIIVLGLPTLHKLYMVYGMVPYRHAHTTLDVDRSFDINGVILHLWLVYDPGDCPSVKRY